MIRKNIVHCLEVLLAAVSVGGVAGWAAVLENDWLRVEVDEGSGDIVSWVSRDNGVQHLRPEEGASGMDPLLGSLFTTEPEVRGLKNRFATEDKEPVTVASWRVLEATAHRLCLQAEEGVTLIYELPPDRAALWLKVVIDNVTGQALRYSAVANLQVGGDYRILTEPTSDFIFVPREETVAMREAVSSMEETFRPSQPWVAVIDRNKNQLFGVTAIEPDAVFTFRSVNQLDQEALLMEVEYPPVPEGAQGVQQLCLVYAAGFNRVSHLSADMVLSVERDEAQGVETVFVFPLRDLNGVDLVIGEGGNATSIPLSGVSPSPLRRTQPGASAVPLKGKLKPGGGDFFIYQHQINP